MADVFRHADYVTGGPAVGIVPAEHDGRIRAHSHDFHEIVYVVDGFTLHQAGGVITLLVAGDLFFVRPGEEHSYINAYQTKLYNLIFEESELGSFLPELSALPGLDVMFGTRGKGTEAEGQSIRLLHVPMNERRNIESALREMAEEVVAGMVVMHVS